MICYNFYYSETKKNYAVQAASISIFSGLSNSKAWKIVVKTEDFSELIDRNEIYLSLERLPTSRA